MTAFLPAAATLPEKSACSHLVGSRLINSRSSAQSWSRDADRVCCELSERTDGAAKEKQPQDEAVEKRQPRRKFIATFAALSGLSFVPRGNATTADSLFLPSTSAETVEVVREFSAPSASVDGTVKGYSNIGALANTVKSQDAVEIVSAIAGGSVGVMTTLVVIESEKKKDYERKMCPYCEGSGVLACGHCWSKGCPNCSRSGNVPCFNCNGTGHMFLQESSPLKMFRGEPTFTPRS